MFRMILFVIMVVSFVFHNWIGKLFSWILAPVVNNTFGAVFIACCLVFAGIALWNLFVGKTQLLGGRNRTTQRTKQ